MRPVRRDNRPGRARCCILEFLWLSSVSWPTTTSHSNSVGECQAARGRPMRPQMCSNETRNVVLFIARHVPARGYVTRLLVPNAASSSRERADEGSTWRHTELECGEEEKMSTFCQHGHTHTHTGCGENSIQTSKKKEASTTASSTVCRE